MRHPWGVFFRRNLTDFSPSAFWPLENRGTKKCRGAKSRRLFLSLEKWGSKKVENGRARFEQGQIRALQNCFAQSSVQLGEPAAVWSYWRARELGPLWAFDDALATRRPGGAVRLDLAEGKAILAGSTFRREKMRCDLCTGMSICPVSTQLKQSAAVDGPKQTGTTGIVEGPIALTAEQGHGIPARGKLPTWQREAPQYARDAIIPSSACRGLAP